MKLIKAVPGLASHKSTNGSLVNYLMSSQTRKQDYMYMFYCHRVVNCSLDRLGSDFVILKDSPNGDIANSIYSKVDAQHVDLEMVFTKSTFIRTIKRY